MRNDTCRDNQQRNPRTGPILPHKRQHGRNSAEETGAPPKHGRNAQHLAARRNAHAGGPETRRHRRNIHARSTETLKKHTKDNPKDPATAVTGANVKQHETTATWSKNGQCQSGRKTLALQPGHPCGIHGGEASV